MKKTKVILLSMLAALLLILGWLMCQVEAECFWNPWIDTQCASGYSEEAFSAIYVGMPLSEVQSFMPTPLETWTNSEGVVRMWYTLDGKCTFGDFAWQNRSISVESGVVTEVTSMTVGD